MELRAGFPSLYFEPRKAATLAMMEKWNSTPKKKTRFLKYFNSIQQIIDNGFLNAFIVEQNNGVLIVPDSEKYDLPAYQAWKAKRISPDAFSDMMYLIGLTGTPEK